MDIKLYDAELIAEKPFTHCILKRENEAKFLTNIVSTYANGFVLAIDNKWGAGKTTFVKMWQQDLENKSFKTLYFNAWENDFENDALTALMAELESLKSNQTETAFKKVLKCGSVLAKNVIPIAIKSVLDKYIGNGFVKDVSQKIIENADDLFQNQLSDYLSKKQGLIEFKKSLSEYIDATKGDKPIVLFIDELDRCRPNYAVEVLEKIKHFFSVPGIVFVLSIDKSQLEHAVRGVYGSEQIDANEYLKRFIDLEYSLMEPDSEKYSQFLYKYFRFDDFFRSQERSKYQQFRNEPLEFVKMARVLFSINKIALRKQEKIIAHTRIVLSTFGENNYVFPEILLFLVYSKMQHNDFYSKLQNKEWNNLQDEIDAFRKILPNTIDEDELQLFIYIEAFLMVMYKNSIDPLHKQLLRDNSNGKEELEIPLKSKLDKSENQSDFIYNILRFERNYDIRRMELSYLIEKVNLASTIIS